MKHLLCFFGLFFIINSVYSQDLNPDYYELVLEDDFNTFNNDIWRIRNKFDHYGEPQVYTNRSENVFVSDGKLVLRCKKEDYICDDLNQWACNKENYDYTSGWVETKSDFYIKYGYIEATMKIPYGYGFWPALWTFVGDGVDGDNAAEIDIFEMLGDKPADVMTTNLHMEYCDEGEDCQLPDYFQKNDLGFDYSKSFNTYGVKWTPHQITWYVNGQVVRTSPNPGIRDYVRVIMNFAITPWNLPNASTPFPSDLIIDEVKLYQRTGNDFLYNSHNQEIGKIDHWKLGLEDDFMVGDYDGDKKDELFINSTTGWATLVNFDGFWGQSWNNGGSNLVKWWKLSESDVKVSGDFNGDGKDDILFTNHNSKWIQLNTYNGSDWTHVYGNGGSGKLKYWNMNAGDKYLAGDFNNDGKDELLILNSNSLWSQMYSFNGSDWQLIWHNGGNGKIKWWYFNSNDIYSIGDFDNDGKEELLCVNNSWSQLNRFNGSDWTHVWGNGGDGKIGYWHVNTGDQFLAGNFNASGRYEMLSISKRWAQMHKFSSGDWNYLWSNNGAGVIHSWFQNEDDVYLAGKFKTESEDLVLAISKNGTVQLLEYRPALSMPNSSQRLMSNLVDEPVFAEQSKVTSRFYPNPARTHVYFNKVDHAIIMNSNGQILKEIKEGDTLEISDLESGLYFVKTISNGEPAIEKLVIQE